MEAKHLVIGVVIFALLGAGLFYLGSLLTGVEKDLQKNDGPPVPVAELLQSVEELKEQTQETQQRQEEILKSLP